MIAVVMVDDPNRWGGPGTVLEVTGEGAAEILARYTDRDGARPAGLRLWASYPGCKVGDRVKSTGVRFAFVLA